MTNNEKKLLTRVIEYSEIYEISIQFWPEQKVIFIAKDGVDLNSWGSSDLETSLQSAIEYLDRINKKP